MIPMRQLFNFLMIVFTAIMLINCRDESDDIKPQGEVTTVSKDTTALSTAVRDSTALQILDSTKLVSDSTPGATNSQSPKKSSLSFTTSEYQQAKFENMPYRVMTP